MKLWIDPINFIADLFKSTLINWGLEYSFVSTISSVIGAVVIATFGLSLVIFLIWVERKIAARLQDRFGPNRVGPYGLFQTFADILKLFTKELITPEGVDKLPYSIAPIIAVASVLLMWAVVPFSRNLVGTDLNVGVLYIVAVGSFGILAILIAGWSSNNKYALLGAFRTIAQLVSYEVPMVLALLIPVILSHSMSVQAIVASQRVWYILLTPITALIFFISSLAEVGRTPFDLLEAESEIVAGFHIEYSGMKFAMFFAGEFLHALTISALTVLLFLGGWRGPFVEQIPLLGTFYFFLKTSIVYFLVVWVRSTLPRIRIDHLLNFNWKFLTPLILMVIIVTTVVEKTLTLNHVTGLAYILGHLSSNVAIVVITMRILRVSGRKHRVQVVGQPKSVAVPQ